MRETPRHQNEEQQSVAVEMGKPATGRRRGSGAVDSDQGRECGADGKESPRRTGVSREEFTALASRVDRMELSVDLIEARLDSVLSKIQSMEEEKVMMMMMMSGNF
nr:hypothetical protein BaRGS_033553 [Batillaria attramentaria]